MSKSSRRRKKTGISYFLREGIYSIFVHGFMSFAAVAVISACLLITVSFALVAYNIGVLIGDVESQNEISVFIEENLTRQEAIAMESEIKKIENIATVEFVSKEQAFDIYLEGFGEDAYIMEGLREDNPLRDGYRLTMKDISKHGETVDEINNLPGVGKTNSRRDVSDRLLKIKNVVNAISITLIGLLGTVSLFIISNTVRLALFYRREEIAIMRMVGATNSFIRMPFVVEGMVLGCGASLFAYGLQYGVYSYIAKGLVASTGFLNAVPFSAFGFPLFFFTTLAGTAIGLIGSLFTIQKFLKV